MIPAANHTRLAPVGQTRAVPIDNAESWDRYAAAYQAEARLPTDAAHYGPDIPSETELRLLGDLKGKRVLELGCGGAQCSIAFARQGASAIGVDSSAEQISYARRLCEQEGVKVELRYGDLADLAFLRGDSIDLVFSAYAFGFVEDLGRVFRQVHRVLKVGAPLVFSLTHPTYDIFAEGVRESEGDAGTEGGSTGEDAGVVRRSYFDRDPVEYRRGGVLFTEYHHTLSDLYMGLVRSNYRVDVMLEPEPLASGPRSHAWSDIMRLVPRTLIIRARKEGN